MKKIQRLCISLLITLTASIPSWAEDVDIYLRHAAALTDTIRPNILFMLDNSGSMELPIRLPDGTPTSETRIDVLKQALLQTLNDVHNVNVGLARFAYLIKTKGPVNAPIMFPVFYVDADVTEVPGEANSSTIEVSSSISRHEDDAEENTGSGKMLLDRKSLRMVYLKQSDDFKGIKIEQPINKASNVAVQWLGNVREIPDVGNKNIGVVKVGSNPLYLGGDPEPNVTNNQGDSLIALRFTGLNIPVGAKIEKAQVEFISDKDYDYENEKDKLKLNIYGAANDGVPTLDPSGKEFKTDKEYLTKETNFPKTKNKVEWIIADPLDQGQSYTTEDISSILQEIVNRTPQKDAGGNEIGGTGWQENNSIVLLFQSAGDSAVSSKGFISAIDNVLYPPPLLRLSWTIENAQVTLRSGKGSWNKTKNAYNVNNGDHAMESGGKMITDGMYLGYQPGKGGIDVTNLEKLRDDAKLAKEQANTNWSTAKTTLAKAKAALSSVNTTGKFGGASSYVTTAQNYINNIKTKETAATKATDKEMWQIVLSAAEPVLPAAQALLAAVNSKNPEITPEQVTTLQVALSAAENAVTTVRTSLAEKGLLTVTKKDGTQAPSAGGKQLENIEALLRDKIQAMWKLAGDLQLAKAKKDVLDAQKAEDTAKQQYLDAKAVHDQAVIDYNTGKKVKIITKTESWVGVNFSALPLPKGASIKEAYITFTHQGSWSEFNLERSAELNLNIYGEKSPSPKGFSADPTLISERPKTSALAEWLQIQGFADKMTFKTVDLSPILQEVINQEDWQSKNGVSFIFENKDKSPNMKGFRRFVGTKDTINYVSGAKAGTPKIDQYTTSSDADLLNFSNLPELTVKYSVGIQEAGGGDSDEQIVGLRFENVDIPRGAKVTRASIDFLADATSEDPSNLLIQIEDSNNAASFKDEEKNISSRKIIKEGILWSDVPAWEKGATYTSPELSSLVQKIVDKKDWCGGRGGMAFVISALEKEKPFRIAKSFDSAAQFAPVLNIEYNAKSVPKETCIQQTYSGQIVFQNDDAEESISGKEQGDVYLISRSLEMGYYSLFSSSRLIGLRFREVPIGKEAKIVAAHLILTAEKSLTEANTKFTITAEKNGEPSMFSKNPANLSRRTKTKANVSWDIGEAWKRGQSYTSPDLSDVVQEVIQQGTWEAYNSMNFFISGQGRRDVVGFESAPQAAAILRIQVDGFLGEGGKQTMTVRTRLKKTTKNITIPPSMTPIPDALYESALYYRSGDVTHGISRYNQSLNLVSHPGSYTGGELLRPPECTLGKPFEPECAAEQITGAARYRSPIGSPCQSNHIILLTDGIATANESVDKIKEMIQDFRKECDTKYVDPDDPTKTIKVAPNEKCALDLAEFLQNTDNSGKFKGEQRVAVHTIGFQLGKGWTAIYKDPTGRVVVKSDGIYRYDDNLEPVPPGVEITPSGYKEKEGETKTNAKVLKFLKTLAARGGGKFYPAESVEDLLVAFKSIIGQAVTNSTTFAAPGVSVNRFSNLFHNKATYYSVFKPDQYARWNGNVKKYHICQGNEGSCIAPELIDAKGQPIVNPDTKEIKSTALSFWSSGNPTPDGSFVTLGGAGERVPASSERRIFTYLGETPPGQDHNIQIDVDSNAIQPTNQEIIRLILERKESEKTEEKEALTKEDGEKTALWIRGQDVMDEDKDNLTEEDRWKIADPLHSSPGSITYGGNLDAPIVKLFIGTNEGLVRMIDDQSGAEEWAFLPKELLSKQYDLMMNTADSGHLYGIDNTPTFWTHDVNNNIQIEPGMGDFVKMYVSMRRGGNNIYALDVTGGEGGPGSPPKLMWTIKGGKDGSPGFGKLGQTWSRPKPVKVRVNGKSKMVLLFGGGYHESQDEIFSSTEKEEGGGNAIFMVDAKTGELLWSVSNEGAHLNLEKMIYPIPSDLALKDSDSDGNMDRIYVGDLGGQVWRIDIDNIDSTSLGVGLLFATVSGGGGTDRRRFFYPPEVVRVEDKTYSTVPTYDLVLMVSGTRPDPLEREVHNRIFAFRDLQLTPMGSAEGIEPITSEELFDATSNVIQEGDEKAKIQAKQDLKEKQGWYIDLQEPGMTQGAWIGEKGLSSPIVLKGKAYVATYVPPLETEDQCSFSEGESRLYALDILNAMAIADLKPDGQLDKADRSKKMGSGLIHTPEPLNPSGTGKTVMSFGRYPGAPDIEESRVPQRSFWMQK